MDLPSSSGKKEETPVLLDPVHRAIPVDHRLGTGLPDPTE
jgi:hypothetical protein